MENTILIKSYSDMLLNKPVHSTMRVTRILNGRQQP